MQKQIPIFQYILCYGSTPLPKRKPGRHLHFNTSYVTVQLFYVLFIFLFRLYFNTSYVTVQRSAIGGFILKLIISIHLMLRFN